MGRSVGDLSFCVKQYLAPGCYVRNLMSHTQAGINCMETQDPRSGVDEKEAPDNTLLLNDITPSFNMLIILEKSIPASLTLALLIPVTFPLDPEQQFFYTSASTNGEAFRDRRFFLTQ